MNQLENNRERRNPSAGRSRGKVTNNRSSGNHSNRSSGRGSLGGQGSRSQSSYRSGQAGRMNAAHNARRNSTHRRKKGPDYKKIAVLGLSGCANMGCVYTLKLGACVKNRYEAKWKGIEG